MKEVLLNSAREKAKQYASTLKRPNRSIELAERMKEKRDESIEKEGNERLLCDPIDIKKTEESYKRLFNF